MGDLEISFSKVIALYVVTKAFTVTVDLLKLMPSIFSEVFEVCFTKNFIESVIDWQWQVANVWLIWYVAQWCWSVEEPLFGERAFMVPDDTKEDKPLSLYYVAVYTQKPTCTTTAGSRVFIKKLRSRVVVWSDKKIFSTSE